MDVPVKGWETSDTDSFRLRAGQLVEVQPKVGSSALFVLTYIYRRGGDLVDMQDVEKAARSDEPFRWLCPANGTYFLRLRNIGDQNGTVEIRILAPRAVTGPNPPNPQGSTYVRVRLYYATNRQSAGLDADPPFFSPEPEAGQKLSYGYCDVSIPRFERRGIGGLPGPSILKLEFRWDPEKHVMVLKDTFQRTTRDDFLKRLAGHVSLSREAEVMVFVHGFNTSFQDAARRAAQIAYDLGFQGIPILYSWPSKQVSSALVDAPLVYARDRAASQTSAIALKTLLTDLTSLSAKRIHVVAHSMGNEVLTRALSDMAIRGEDTSKLRQIALLAPDVDVNLFLQLAADFRKAAQASFTLYASEKDGALDLSRTFQQFPRLGQGGQSIFVQPGMNTIDASRIDTSIVGLGHQYYGDSRSVLSDLSYLLQGVPPEKRHGLRPVERSGKKYWVLAN